MFADDMNAWQAFDGRAEDSDPNTVGFDVLRRVQTEVHKWGAANQIRFDAGKETFHYLHSQDGFSFSDNPTFRILGCEFDAKLLMHEAVHTLSVEAGWRLRSLLRSHRYFDQAKMVLLYKSLVLSYIESATPAVYHAADSVLAKIDRIQDRLLSRLKLSQTEALFRYCLAPLRTRRDIAMLGLLHRIALGNERSREDLQTFSQRPS